MKRNIASKSSPNLRQSPAISSKGFSRSHSSPKIRQTLPNNDNRGRPRGANFSLKPKALSSDVMNSFMPQLKQEGASLPSNRNTNIMNNHSNQHLHSGGEVVRAGFAGNFNTRNRYADNPIIVDEELNVLFNVPKEVSKPYSETFVHKKLLSGGKVTVYRPEGSMKLFKTERDNFYQTPIQRFLPRSEYREEGSPTSEKNFLDDYVTLIPEIKSSDCNFVNEYFKVSTTPMPVNGNQNVEEASISDFSRLQVRSDPN